MHARVKRHRDNLEVNVFNENGAKSSYNNIITKDPNRIAQIFIDLSILGFPIEKAIKIFKDKVKKRDWMGLK